MKYLKIKSYIFFLLGWLAFAPPLDAAISLENNPLPTDKQPQLIFSIYPNPYDQGPLFLKCPSTSPKEIIIYNIMGEVEYQLTTQEKMINLDQLKTGIYLFQVTQDQKTGIQRLVVK